MNTIPKKIPKDLLLDNCHHVEQQEVRHDFSPEEMIQLKSDHFITGAHKYRREEIKKAINSLLDKDTSGDDIKLAIDDLKWNTLGEKGIKKLKADHKAEYIKINKGYTVEEMDVYAFDYQEEGLMAFYGPEGDLISTRELYPEERQTSIINIKKIANL